MSQSMTDALKGLSRLNKSIDSRQEKIMADSSQAVTFKASVLGSKNM